MRAHTITTMSRRMRAARRALASRWRLRPGDPGDRERRAQRLDARNTDDASRGRRRLGLPVGQLDRPARERAERLGGTRARLRLRVAERDQRRARRRADVRLRLADRSGDGFDWASALVGAGAALALAALGGAALLTVRRRTRSRRPPSAG